MRLLRTLLSGTALTLVLLWTPSHSWAQCDATGADAEALFGTYQAIDYFCVCDGSSPFRRWNLACARDLISYEVGEGSLSPACSGQAYR